MITRDEAFSLLGATASRWNAHNAPRLGASLAYYALLSLAPLSILLVAICSLVFSRSTAESNLLQQLERIVGHSGANTLRAVFDASRHHPGSGVIAGVANGNSGTESPIGPSSRMTRFMMPRAG